LTFLFQQLAALLIARQVIGNLKESALPYLLEQLRLAKLSFDLFGALSPSDERKNSEGPDGTSPSLGVGNLSASPTPTASPSKTTSGTLSGNRNVSQAELESSLFKVQQSQILRFASRTFIPLSAARYMHRTKNNCMFDLRIRALGIL